MANGGDASAAAAQDVSLEAGLVIAPAQVNTGAGGAWMMY